ncbi:MAG: hypothetical protein HC824_08280 [Synechococcales cyanobacterium RM1_1_8]|nr:hypothetical protein [Synechococcales cyanobacterium RM1_1_8]
MKRWKWRSPRRRKRRRASAGSSLETDDLETNGVDADGDQSASARPTTASYRRANAANGDEPLGDLDGDLEDELALDSEPDGELDGELDGENGDDDDDAFDDAFDEDDLEDDDDDGSDNITALRRRPSGTDLVQVLPLEEANLSRMLYLVIDRTADLITMPMQHFSDLGQLPVEEEEKKTLPVFENHRVARRFSQRNQRVIKVPDGQLLLKTAAWLEAKGITRCLLDGQVYSLEADSEA